MLGFELCGFWKFQLLNIVEKVNHLLITHQPQQIHSVLMIIQSSICTLSKWIYYYYGNLVHAHMFSDLELVRFHFASIAFLFQHTMVGSSLKLLSLLNSSSVASDHVLKKHRVLLPSS